jgi:hypothetical protein
MSMHKHLYLGPYVECTYKDATRTAYVFGCTNKKCKKHPKQNGPDAEGKFCSACASPNGAIPFEVNDRPDVAEIVDENLFEIPSEENDKILWLAPNVRRIGDPRPKFDDDGEIHLDLQKANPEAETIWFKDAFAKELRALEKEYETVTVKWGLHQYFM